MGERKESLIDTQYRIAKSKYPGLVRSAPLTFRIEVGVEDKKEYTIELNEDFPNSPPVIKADNYKVEELYFSNPDNWRPFYQLFHIVHQIKYFEEEVKCNYHFTVTEELTNQVQAIVDEIPEDAPFEEDQYEEIISQAPLYQQWKAESEQFENDYQNQVPVLKSELEFREKNVQNLVNERKRLLENLELLKSTVIVTEKDAIRAEITKIENEIRIITTNIVQKCANEKNNKTKCDIMIALSKKKAKLQAIRRQLKEILEDESNDEEKA